MYQNYDERGGSIFDVRLDYNNKSRKTLEMYGDQIIRYLKVSRAPIPSAITSALNFVTRGKAKEHYDDFFHLSLIASLDSKDVIIEKNEVVNISTEYEMTGQRDLMDVPLHGKKITLKEMMERALDWMGKDDYFRYDAFDNNCQVFIDKILHSNNLLTPALHKFLFQDLKHIVKETPWLARKFANFATHTAAFWDKLTGKGKEDIEKQLISNLLDYCTEHNLELNEAAFDQWHSNLPPQIKNMVI